MIILALGVALWAGVHFLPSVAPALRERLIDGIGMEPYKGLFSLDMVIAIVLIVWGYRAAPFEPVYDPPAWGVHLNNLLMIAAIYLMGVGGARGWVATKLRHPMLLGVVVWATAHLLANGDQASIILFGGMLLWSLGMMWMINRRVGAWVPPKHSGARGEVILIGATLAIFLVIAFAHGWLLGVHPFPH